MTITADIHGALIARAEVMATALSLPAVWSRKGGDQPTAEHIRVFHLPNDNVPADLSSDVMERQGFLAVTLVSPLDVYEIVSQEKAGEIVAFFPRALRLTANTTGVKITGHTVRQGRQEGQRWETPILISYWSMT